MALALCLLVMHFVQMTHKYSDLGMNFKILGPLTFKPLKLLRNICVEMFVFGLHRDSDRS